MNLIEHVLATTQHRQVDLANFLGVSAAQISKWKRGEPIPPNRAEEISQLAGLFDDDLVWVRLVKNRQNGEAWIRWIGSLTEFCEAWPQCLVDMPERYARRLLSFLAEAGIEIGSAPQIYQSSEQVVDESEQPMAKLFDQVITCWGFLDEWRIHHFERFDFNDNDDYEIQENLRYDCLRLAISHIEPKLLGALNVDTKQFESFARSAAEEARFNVHEFCGALVSRGISPLQDYFIFVSVSPREIHSKYSIRGDNGILGYLTYGERVLLEKSEVVHRLLKEINSKLD